MPPLYRDLLLTPSVTLSHYPVLFVFIACNIMRDYLVCLRVCLPPLGYELFVHLVFCYISISLAHSRCSINMCVYMCVCIYIFRLIRVILYWKLPSLPFSCLIWHGQNINWNYIFHLIVIYWEKLWFSFYWAIIDIQCYLSFRHIT